jgi:hypothetical protein
MFQRGVNNMPKMVCVECKTELQIAKNDVHVIEYFLDPPQPYKIWNADGWECPECHKRIIAGFASGPFAQHWEPDFAETLNEVINSEQIGYWVIHNYEHGYIPV